MKAGLRAEMDGKASKSGVTALGRRVTQDESRVANLVSDVPALKNRVTQGESQVADLVTKVETLRTQMEEVKNGKNGGIRCK